MLEKGTVMTNETERQSGGQPANKNALKRDQPADSFLYVRVPHRMKAGWVKASHGRSLSDWVIDTLERAAARELRR